MDPAPELVDTTVPDPSADVWFQDAPPAGDEALPAALDVGASIVDADDWPYGIDTNRVALLSWGRPEFTAGDLYLAPGPSWWLGAWKVGGAWWPELAAWHVPEAEPAGQGSLWTAVDRTVLTNDLTMQMEVVNLIDGSLFVDLADTNGCMLATNLYGELTGSVGEWASLGLRIPLQAYPDAALIGLRREAGEVWVFETRLTPAEAATNTLAEAEDTATSGGSTVGAVTGDTTRAQGGGASGAGGAGDATANPATELPSNPSSATVSRKRFFCTLSCG